MQVILLYKDSGDLRIACDFYVYGQGSFKGVFIFFPCVAGNVLLSAILLSLATYQSIYVFTLCAPALLYLMQVCPRLSRFKQEHLHVTPISSFEMGSTVEKLLGKVYQLLVLVGWQLHCVYWPDEFLYVDFLLSSLSPPAASVHPSERAASGFLVVHCPVRLHVPGQLVRHRVSLLLPAGLLGLPAVCLRLHVSLRPHRHKFSFPFLFLYQ